MNKSLSELPVSVCHPFGRLRVASEAKPKNPGFVSQLAAQMLHGVYPERSRRVQHDMPGHVFHRLRARATK